MPFPTWSLTLWTSQWSSLSLPSLSVKWKEVWSILMPRGRSITCVWPYKRLHGYPYCYKLRNWKSKRGHALLRIMLTTGGKAEKMWKGTVEGSGAKISHIRTYPALLHGFSLLASSSIPGPLPQFLTFQPFLLGATGMHPGHDKVMGPERTLQGSSSSHGAAPGAQYVLSGAARTRKEPARQLFSSRLSRG